MDGVLQQHVAIQLTQGGGPEPLTELQRIYKAAREGVEGATWIATRKPGAAFVQDAHSRMLAFARDPSAHGTVCVLNARIDQRSTQLPHDPVAEDLYGGRSQDFHAYWRICDVGLERMSWADLPGETARGLPLARAFKGSLSFAYWQPPSELTDFGVVAHSENVPERLRYRAVKQGEAENTAGTFSDAGQSLEGENLVTLSAQAGPIGHLSPTAGTPHGFLSVAGAAELLGVAKSTVVRRVERDEMVGFRSIDNLLCIPKEQFANGVVVNGISDILGMFAEESADGAAHTNHRGAWNFLVTSLYAGSAEPRPIDRLNAATDGRAQANVVAELARAKEGLDYGDHV